MLYKVSFSKDYYVEAESKINAFDYAVTKLHDDVFKENSNVGEFRKSSAKLIVTFDINIDVDHDNF